MLITHNYTNLETMLPGTDVNPADINPGGPVPTAFSDIPWPGVVKDMVQHKGYGFIATELGDDVFFVRGQLRTSTGNRYTPMPKIGSRVTFVRVPVTALKPNGQKKSDQAIDIEVL